MPRSKNSNLASRAKAYEMYAAGVPKASIARELGLTKAAITHWSKKDGWDQRLSAAVRSAESAIDLALGDQIGMVLAHLRGKLQTRIRELEGLCSAAERPQTRLSAIKLWFDLANVKQVVPDPTKLGTSRSIELIQDLLEEVPQRELHGNPASVAQSDLRGGGPGREARPDLGDLSDRTGVPDDGQGTTGPHDEVRDPHPL